MLWKNKSGSTFQDLTENLPDDIASRLYEARREAMKAYPETAAKPKHYWKWVSSGLVSAFAIAMITINVGFQPVAVDPGVNNGHMNQLIDMEILADADSLPMLEELDFYLGLEEPESAV